MLSSSSISVADIMCSFKKFSPMSIFFVTFPAVAASVVVAVVVVVVVFVVGSGENLGEDRDGEGSFCGIAF